jgi:dUTP pyrophosphatase
VSAPEAGTARRPAASDTRVEFLLDHPDAVLPAAAHPGDAGLDLRSVEQATIPPGGRRRIDTGVRMALPPGHAGLVVPRSGLADRHGIAVVNAPGLIDQGYRGRIGVLLLNTDASEPFAVEVGDRIAQLVVIEAPAVRPVQADSLDETERGEGGFGSSGRS